MKGWDLQLTSAHFEIPGNGHYEDRAISKCSTIANGRDQDVTRSFQGFPSHLRNLKFSETKALFGVYCNRTASDPLRNTKPDECRCGSGCIETEYLFISCPLRGTTAGNGQLDKRTDKYEGICLRK
jgi:hypothetical protein